MAKKCIYVQGRQLYADEGALLSDILADAGIIRHLDCGGLGSCGKCAVLVDGRSELSCQYRVYSDITVTLPDAPGKDGSFLSVSSKAGKNGTCFLLDIGTTTLNLKLCGDDGRVFGTASALNPQRRFGADVMSRISYCSSNGVSDCRKALMNAIGEMMQRLCDPAPRRLIVAGNTAMLHIFAGEDVKGLGVYPYTPSFLEGRTVKTPELAPSGVAEAELLPSLSAFIGADALAGISACGLPEAGKYKLLIDLGTNAEILLFSDKKLYATSAAAGPCFEGATISCGMPALPGAISSFTLDPEGKRLYTVVGGQKPCGICGTAIFDLVAALLDNGMISRDGRMLCGSFEVCREPAVILTQNDVRQFQLAKAAVAAGIELLMKKAGTDLSDLDELIISGGFASQLNVRSAVRCGLIPAELAKRSRAISNSCMEGLARYRSGVKAYETLLSEAETLDCAMAPDFQSVFLKNIDF